MSTVDFIGAKSRIYSAILLGHGGCGEQKMFTTPIGHFIPRMIGVGKFIVQSHHENHSPLTTSVHVAGTGGGEELETAIIVGLRLRFENHPVWGVSPFQVEEILQTLYLRLRIGDRVVHETEPGKTIVSATFKNSVQVRRLDSIDLKIGLLKSIEKPDLRTFLMWCELGTAEGELK